MASRDSIPHRSDAEIAALAAVTDADVDDAAAYWREHAAGKSKGLVDAEEKEDR